jgi:hypothetical protein
MGCNMSLNVHLLDSHLDFFPENLVAVSDKHEERFHQDISNMETLKRDVPQATYSRKSTTVTF